MKAFKLTRGSILIILPILVFMFFPHQTKSTEVGVRVVKWWPFTPRGVVNKIYAPGAIHFFPVFFNEWHTFDAKLQNMEMTSGAYGARKGKDDLVFKTIDGNDIALDVIIAYRIDPQKAPELLQSVGASISEIEERLVRPITRNMTRELFGELKTEDFYVANSRTEKANMAQKTLNEVLNPLGVIIESVLPKDYRFNSAYQQAIEEKKVADQMVERFKSEAKATVEEYHQRIQQAQGEVNKMVADSDGEYAKAKIGVDAYYAQQELIAQAIEAEGAAESQGIEKMVDALNSGGGKTMVKMRLAEALIGKKIYLLPFGDTGSIDLKSTNVNDLLKVIGLKELSNQ